MIFLDERSRQPGFADADPLSRKVFKAEPGNVVGKDEQGDVGNERRVGEIVEFFPLLGPSYEGQGIALALPDTFLGLRPGHQAYLDGPPEGLADRLYQLDVGTGGLAVVQVLIGGILVVTKEDHGAFCRVLGKNPGDRDRSKAHKGKQQ